MVDMVQKWFGQNNGLEAEISLEKLHSIFLAGDPTKMIIIVPSGLEKDYLH